MAAPASMSTSTADMRRQQRDADKYKAVIPSYCDFDRDMFRASLRPGVVYREGFISHVEVTMPTTTADPWTRYHVDVLMQYNGATIAIGRILLRLSTSGELYVVGFSNFFRTVEWLADLHAECFPHVVTSGILTSALYWFVKSIATDPTQSISLHAQNDFNEFNGEPQAINDGQRKLEGHYALMGFRSMGTGGNGMHLMGCSIAHFLDTTRDFATVTFTFAPNAVHPMTTRNRRMA